MVDRTDPQRALIGALRVRRNETQVTRAYSALAAADPSLPRQIAGAVLRLASESGSQRAADALQELPASMTMDHEESLGPVGGVWRPRGGRADWHFTSSTPFALLVEAKIGSGQGLDQLERYLNRFSKGALGGVVLVTRRRETVAPRLAGRKHWLGQIHWSALLPALAEIRPENAAVRTLWDTWTQVLLDSSGDLSEAPVGWGLDGGTVGQRNVLLLRGAATQLARSVGAELAQRTGRSPEALCTLSAGPRTKNPRRSGDEAFLTFYVPAAGGWSALRVSVEGARAPLKVTTRAHPGAPQRGRREKARLQSVAALEGLGLVANPHGWYEIHDSVAPDERDDPDDPVAALCACAEGRLRAIIAAGAIDHLLR